MRKLITVGLLVTVLLGIGATTVGARQDHPAPTVSYVVQAGDTIWGIAGSVGGSEDRRAVVDRIIALNELSSALVFPGQELQLPAAG
ncbi:MAG TPA: LysM peptidoglycan-binding domain-containing protein [Actinomycetota bacterium]